MNARQYQDICSYFGVEFVGIQKDETGKPVLILFNLNKNTESIPISEFSKDSLREYIQSKGGFEPEYREDNRSSHHDHWADWRDTW